MRSGAAKMLSAESERLAEAVRRATDERHAAGLRDRSLRAIYDT